MASGQNPTTPQPQQDQLKAPTETLVVLGTATPVPLAESSRSVEVVPVGDIGVVTDFENAVFAALAGSPPRSQATR